MFTSGRLGGLLTPGSSWPRHQPMPQRRGQSRSAFHPSLPTRSLRSPATLLDRSAAQHGGRSVQLIPRHRNEKVRPAVLAAGARSVGRYRVWRCGGTARRRAVLLADRSRRSIGRSHRPGLEKDIDARYSTSDSLSLHILARLAVLASSCHPPPLTPAHPPPPFPASTLPLPLQKYHLFFPRIQTTGVSRHPPRRSSPAPTPFPGARAHRPSPASCPQPRPPRAMRGSTFASAFAGRGDTGDLPGATHRPPPPSTADQPARLERATGVCEG